MLIAPHTLSIVTTYRCTAECEHCCFSCSPRSRVELTPARMREILDQAAQFSSIKVAVFTGGECYMLGRELDRLVQHATSRGFTTRTVSNAFWAPTREAARARLARLKDHGLKEANYSTGEQHSRFVPPERVRHAAIAAAELGLVSIIAVDSFGDSRFNFEDFVSEPEFGEYIDAGKIILRVSPWMKFNGNRHISYTKKYLRHMENNRTAGTGCPTVLKVLGVLPNEELCVCCGLTMLQIPEMRVGSLRQNTIKQLLNKVPDDFLKVWLSLYGPDAILRYAQKLDPTIPSLGHHAHTCDVCRFVYHNKHIRRLVMDQPPPNMRDLVSQYVQSLVMPGAELDTELSSRILRSGSKVTELKEIHQRTVFKRRDLSVPAPCRACP